MTRTLPSTVTFPPETVPIAATPGATPLPVGRGECADTTSDSRVSSSTVAASGPVDRFFGAAGSVTAGAGVSATFPALAPCLACSTATRLGTS